MGVLWLKLAELAYIEAKTGEKPTLLLDDIFSELDHNHRKVVIQIIGSQQTVVTAADEHLLKGIRSAKTLKL
jgi:DNA replication and repair protein RecF